MNEILLAAAVAATAFVSTNLDNLIVLTALLAVAERRAPVLAGYGMVMLGVVGVALALALLGRVIPVEAVGLLGLVPLTMGIRGLLRRGGDGAESPSVAAARGGVGAVVAGLAPLSGDSLAVMVPLLAENPPRLQLVSTTAWCAMALLSAVLAALLVSMPGPRETLARVGTRIMPLLMIVLGLYILADTPTDVLVRP